MSSVAAPVLLPPPVTPQPIDPGVDYQYVVSGSGGIDGVSVSGDATKFRWSVNGRAVTFRFIGLLTDQAQTLSLTVFGSNAGGTASQQVQFTLPAQTGASTARLPCITEGNPQSGYLKFLDGVTDPALYVYVGQAVKLTSAWMGLGGTLGFVGQIDSANKRFKIVSTPGGSSIVNFVGYGDVDCWLGITTAGSDKVWLGYSSLGGSGPLFVQDQNGTPLPGPLQNTVFVVNAPTQSLLRVSDTPGGPAIVFGSTAFHYTDLTALYNNLTKIAIFAGRLAPAINSDAELTVASGSQVNYQVTADLPLSTVNARHLPAGLSISNGIISGTATTPGTYGIVLEAYSTLTSGSFQRYLTLIVTGAADAPPQLTQGVAENTVGIGASVTEAVQATGSNLTYAWFRDGVAIAGSTQSSLIVKGAATAPKDEEIKCVISNAAGSIESKNMLHTTQTPTAAAPVITKKLVDQNVQPGGQGTFTVTATGAESYDWYVAGKPVLGARGPSLSVQAASSAPDDKEVKVIVSNGAGIATSAANLHTGDPVVHPPGGGGGGGGGGYYGGGGSSPAIGATGPDLFLDLVSHRIYDLDGSRADVVEVVFGDAPLLIGFQSDGYAGSLPSGGQIRLMVKKRSHFSADALIKAQLAATADVASLSCGENWSDANLLHLLTSGTGANTVDVPFVDLLGQISYRLPDDAAGQWRNTRPLRIRLHNSVFAQAIDGEGFGIDPKPGGGAGGKGSGEAETLNRGVIKVRLPNNGAVKVTGLFHKTTPDLLYSVPAQLYFTDPRVGYQITMDRFHDRIEFTINCSDIDNNARSLTTGVPLIEHNPVTGQPLASRYVDAELDWVALDYAPADTVYPGDGGIDPYYNPPPVVLQQNMMLPRGIGPTLEKFGVTDCFVAPRLKLYNQDKITDLNGGPDQSGLIASCDSWKAGDVPAIIKTGLAPLDSLESAILADLQPGPNYKVTLQDQASAGYGVQLQVPLLVGMSEADATATLRAASPWFRGFVSYNRETGSGTGSQIVQQQRPPAGAIINPSETTVEILVDDVGLSGKFPHSIFPRKRTGLLEVYNVSKTTPLRQFRCAGSIDDPLKDNLIMGFVVVGSTPKRVAIEGHAGAGGALIPHIDLYNGKGEVIDSAAGVLGTAATLDAMVTDGLYTVILRDLSTAAAAAQFGPGEGYLSVTDVDPENATTLGEVSVRGKASEYVDGDFRLSWDQMVLNVPVLKGFFKF